MFFDSERNCHFQDMTKTGHNVGDPYHLFYKSMA